jgi:hypothetical protein
MKRQLLLDLADYIETLPPERFNITRWWEKTKCGTAGCMMGHAPDVPSIAAAGLARWPFSERSMFVARNGEVLEYLYAAPEVFDISVSEANYLFASHDAMRYATTPTEAAKWLRTFVEKHDARSQVDQLPSVRGGDAGSIAPPTVAESPAPEGSPSDGGDDPRTDPDDLRPIYREARS